MAIRPYKGILPTIGPRVYIDEAASIIGDVVIGADTSIWPMCSVRGDVNYIRIGARTNIQDGSILHGTHDYEGVPGGWAVIVGDDVTIGHQCIIHGCTVESRCLIGMGSAILDGAVLRSGVFLGAGSLVTEGKELEGGYLWMGRPAKRVRELTDEEKAWFEYSARHYVEAGLKNDLFKVGWAERSEAQRPAFTLVGVHFVHPNLPFLTFPAPRPCRRFFRRFAFRRDQGAHDGLRLRALGRLQTAVFLQQPVFVRRQGRRPFRLHPVTAGLLRHPVQVAGRHAGHDVLHVHAEPGTGG
jgi:carbonic anhydrase/acetyltransferase-like protein (isoleucine patch superfamily)